MDPPACHAFPRRPRDGPDRLPRSLTAALAPYDERRTADGGFEHIRDRQAVRRTQAPSDPVPTLLYDVDGAAAS
ncbi:hypothetical protein [Streptomyces sp. NPDC093591]|uniref:hypothetical protein n=1 Tax=Streptomyces sp. NPDC093591 TaxID=3366044 RepID=UPI003826FB30